MKKNNIRTAYILTAICLLIAGILLYYLLINMFNNLTTSNWAELERISGKGTKLEFNIKNLSNIGFNRDITFYTENGITQVAFSGKITTDGTAKIIVTANENDVIIYNETYSNIGKEAINFEVDDLLPYTYYTLRFSSADAKTGCLLLKTKESLSKQPEPPKPPKRLEQEKQPECTIPTNKL